MISILNKIKRNSFLRSFLNIYRKYFINYRKQLAYCAKDAIIMPPMNICGYNNIYLYEDSSIMSDSTIHALNAKFVMKRKSVCGPRLFVSTGNHERRLGDFLVNIKEIDKDKSLDRDVIIEEDCWLGGNVTLLNGVIIRRGTTIANGAVVTKSTPPYSIVGGVPAKFIKFYWTINEILMHESSLYSERERYTREELEVFYKEFK